MKAAQQAQTHQPIEISDIENPKPAAGEVIVNLKAAALNHRDVFVQAGKYPGMSLPVVLGSDGAGVVTELGAGVDEAFLGAEVIINPALNWGVNPAFYGKDFKILGMPDNGTFSEFIKIAAKNIYPKPAHLSFEAAAALPLAGLTGWRALMSRAGLKNGERVLVTGIGGGVALFVLQFAVAAGAEVWVTSGSDEKIQQAVALGARGGVNYRQPDWLKTLMETTGGGRAGYFDVIIDSAGGPSFAKLIDAAAIGGRICFFGGTAGNITDIMPSKVFFKQLTILGSTMGSDAEFADMVAFVNLHHIQPVVDSVLPLDDAQIALNRMNEGQQFGKIILKIG